MTISSREIRTQYFIKNHLVILIVFFVTICLWYFTGSATYIIVAIITVPVVLILTGTQVISNLDISNKTIHIQFVNLRYQIRNISFPVNEIEYISLRTLKNEFILKISTHRTGAYKSLEFRFLNQETKTQIWSALMHSIPEKCKLNE